MAKPKPSEWGKLSEGQAYRPLATDLARALFYAIGGLNGALLWYVAERSWRPVLAKRREATTDPVPVPIPVVQLAKEWGVPKQRINDARKHLVESGLLVSCELGYWVNKEAHDWIKPGKGGSPPMLPEAMLAYAKDGRSRGNSSTDQEPPSNGNPLLESQNSVTHQQPPSNGNPLPDTCRSNGNPLPPETDDDCPSNGNPLPESRNSVTGVTEIRYSHIERARKKIKSLKTLVVVPPLPPEPSNAPEPINLKALRPFKPDPAELERIRQWAETLHDDYLSQWVKGSSTSYPLDWIEDAILVALKIGTGSLARYANGTLIEWGKTGVKDTTPRESAPSSGDSNSSTRSARAGPRGREPDPDAIAKANAASEARKKLIRESMNGV